MKKNTTYILLGLAVLGGAWYFMKSKQKKGIVIVPAPESITQEQFEQTEQPSPSRRPQKQRPMAKSRRRHPKRG